MLVVYDTCLYVISHLFTDVWLFFFFYNEIHFLILILRDWYVKKRCRRIAQKMLFISFRETKGCQSSVNFMLYDFGIIALELFSVFFSLDS